MAALKDHTLYCGTKAALDMISRVMALELGKHKVVFWIYKLYFIHWHLYTLSLRQIRVNCVNPTVVMTEMGKLGWSDPFKADPMLAKIPMGRFAGMTPYNAFIYVHNISQLILLKYLNFTHRSGRCSQFCDVSSEWQICYDQWSSSSCRWWILGLPLKKLKRSIRVEK